MTPRQRTALVNRAIKAMDKAADLLSDLAQMADERAEELDVKIPRSREAEFRSELRERAEYWRGARWWK